MLVLSALKLVSVVPYIGTWIETCLEGWGNAFVIVVPYIGTWIETGILRAS